MRVLAVLYGDEGLIAEMDNKVLEQIGNVACLPGIVDAAYTMPDAHWGYGFPIGGVAAFDPDLGGVVSAGGVGFDISCGVRTLLTGLKRQDLEPREEALAHGLSRAIPAGVGSTGKIVLDESEMDRMLEGGARWAVGQGYGRAEDLDRIEERGCIPGARPEAVSHRARHRQREEMGTLGSGNHYLEVQEVTAISDETVAAAFGLARGDVVVSIHCGSRGLGHQIGTEFLREMALAAPAHGITLPDLELARTDSLRDQPTRSRPCAQASIAPWPTARSSRVWRVGFSRISFPNPCLPYCSKSRRTPARRKSARFPRDKPVSRKPTASASTSSSTARVPRGLLVRIIRTCRPPSPPPASRF